MRVGKGRGARAMPAVSRAPGQTAGSSLQPSALWTQCGPMGGALTWRIARARPWLGGARQLPRAGPVSSSPPQGHGGSAPPSQHPPTTLHSQ